MKEERFWRITPVPFKCEPARPLVCLFCGGNVQPLIAKSVRFKLDRHGDRPHSHAFDNWCRCVECGFTGLFGPAVPEEEYREIVKIHIKKVEDGKFITVPEL